MSTLEFKGGMLEMIAKIDDRDSLIELAEIIKEFVNNRLEDADFGSEMTISEKKKLERAIIDSEDQSKWISHEDVMKRFKE